MRLLLDPKRHSDLDAIQLTTRLAEQIEDECTFPGQIKVTALREVIASSYARIREKPIHSGTAQRRFDQRARHNIPSRRYHSQGQSHYESRRK